MSWRPYGRSQPVLHDLSLRIPAGERVLLVGPSGSGKSTLLRALAGLLETADSGERSGTVTVGGIAPDTRPGQVGLVLQEPGAGLVAATVERDVAFGPENVRMPPEQMHAVVPDLLADVRLALPGTTSTSALSGGETQRLALAGALALGPQLLLLDEALAMLDQDTAEQVRDIVLDVVAARQLTLVVVEHRLEPWVAGLDRLIALNDRGEIIADGPLAATLASHGEALTAAGVWVPGVPAPEPVAIGADVFGADVVDASSAGDRGEPILRAQARLFRSASTPTATLPPRLVAEIEPMCVCPGELVALIGPSGSGKSTALLALGDLTEPSDNLQVDGQVTGPGDGEPDPGRVGWVPQWVSSTIVTRTVWDEVTLTGRLTGLPEQVLRHRAESLLDALGLTHLREADPRQISGGEQRRVALVAAALHTPALLLLDEPTIGQDRHTWATVVGVVDALTRAGTAVVAATHDGALIDRADQVIRLDPPRERVEVPIRRPLASRCGPLALMAASALGVPLGIIAQGWRNQLILIAVLLLTLGPLQLATGEGSRPRGRPRKLLFRVVPGLVGSVLVGWSVWLFGGHDLTVALGTALRVVILILPSAFLLGFIDPDSLSDHLAQRLRLPARPVIAVGAALMRVASLHETLREIRRARRVRGLDRAGGFRARLDATVAITIGVLVKTLMGAATLALAMDARGFAGASRRSWYAKAPWRIADTLLVLLAAFWLVLAARLKLP